MHIGENRVKSIWLFAFDESSLPFIAEPQKALGLFSC